MPLYRQESIFARAGLALPRSTLGQWVGVCGVRLQPLVDPLHARMMAQRQKVPEGSAIAKALDYGLKRWVALTRYLDDGDVPIDNNWVENQICPWAIGLRTGCLRGRCGQARGRLP